MAQFKTHFTIEEARATLPDLKRRFERIHGLYSEVQDLQKDFEAARKLIRANGHSPKETGFESRLQELQAALQEIVDLGIEIKDAARGLVDFPHWRDGEE